MNSNLAVSTGSGSEFVTEDNAPRPSGTLHLRKSLPQNNCRLISSEEANLRIAGIKRGLSRIKWRCTAADSQEVLYGSPGSDRTGCVGPNTASFAVKSRRRLNSSSVLQTSSCRPTRIRDTPNRSTPSRPHLSPRQLAYTSGLHLNATASDHVCSLA